MGAWEMMTMFRIRSRRRLVPLVHFLLLDRMDFYETSHFRQV